MGLHVNVRHAGTTGTMILTHVKDKGAHEVSNVHASKPNIICKQPANQLRNNFGVT